jgi:MFS transporter, ACS family, tartrate transporter
MNSMTKEAVSPGAVPLFLTLFTLVGMALAYLPAFWAIPTERLSHSAAATAVGMINAVGSMAGFAGPYAFGYLYNRTGSFSVGLGLMMVTALVGGLLILRIPDVRRTPIQSC